jgi:hypothetical protein
LQSGLFSHYAAFAVSGYGVFFSFNDELKLLRSGESSWAKLGFIGAVLIPTSYLGYIASDLFKLECSSREIYGMLSVKAIWAPYRFVAAKALFDQLAYCIDRNVTLGPSGIMVVADLLKYGREDPKTRQTSIDSWRHYIAEFNKDLPDQKLIESRYEDSPYHSVPSDSTKSARDDVAKITWGDSIYQRLYGSGNALGFVGTSSDFDGSDFKILFAIGQKCSKINAEFAKQLYAKFQMKKDGS